MTWLLALITGLPGVFGKFFDYLTKKSDNTVLTHQADVSGDTTVMVAEGKERVDTQRIISDARAHDRESLWTAWMLPSAFGVSLVHYAAVVFDSIPMFGHRVGAWHVAALPGDYTGTSVTIILTCCGIAAGKHVVKRFTR